jgi:serine/alanine adding enzyme
VSVDGTRERDRSAFSGPEVAVKTQLDEHAWRRFVDTHSAGNVFHTPEMYEVYRRAKHHRPSLWAATDASGAPLALLLPVEVTLVGGPIRPFTSRAVAYGGLLCGHDPASSRAVAALLVAHKREVGGRVLFAELRHLSDPAHLLPALRMAGFAHEQHLNYLIRLDRPEAELWSALSGTARQRIRSAERKGVHVNEVVDPTGLEEAYRLLEVVYRRAGVPLGDRSLFHAALSVLGSKGIRIITASLAGRVIGARILLMHGGRLLDWYAASDRAFASYSPNEALVWHTLQWGRERGFELFDFGGAGRPDEPYGPREFKSKFGGELVNFGRDVRVHAPMRLCLAGASYEVGRRVSRLAASSGRRRKA